MSRWKDLERRVAKDLGGKRILRGADMSESAPDVHLPHWPEAKVDCKSRKRHAHHKLFKEIEEKYGTPALLVTREVRKASGGPASPPILVTMRLETLVGLLTLANLLRDGADASGHVADRLEDE